MHVEEKTVNDVTAASDASFSQKVCSEVISNHSTIDMVAKRYGIKSDWVNGYYSIIFKTRPPMHWDADYKVWRFGIMSQLIENETTGREVCVVCTKGLVKIHRVSQDGPPDPGSHFLYLPWREVTFEQEGIVKKMITNSVFGLNQYIWCRRSTNVPSMATPLRRELT